MLPPREPTTPASLTGADSATAQLCAILRHDLPGDWTAADWPAVMATATRHGLAPMLYLGLAQSALQPPAELVHTLRVRVAETAARNMCLYAALGRILPSLTDGGIDAVVLKGADLAARVYPTIAARPTSDLDLLIRKEHLDRAVTALGPVGYTRWADVPLTGDSYARWRKARNLVAERTDLPPLDLHWHLLDRNWALRERINLDWFWEQTEEAEVEGVRLRRLRAEALLLHLCLHVDYHGVGTRLLWVYDIDRLLRTQAQWRWDVFAAEVKRLGCERAVGTVLRAADAHFGTPLPEEALGWVNATRPPAERLLVAMLGHGVVPANMVDVVNSFTIPDRRQRLVFLRDQVLPSVAYMRKRSGVRHDALLPLAYCQRWLRGVVGLARLARAWVGLKLRKDL